MASAPIDRRGIIRKSFLKGSAAALVAANTTGRLAGVTALAQTRPRAPRVGGTLRFGYPLDFTRDDPVNAPWMDDSDLQIYERLLAKDFHGNLVPQLAESFDVSSDGLTLT